MMKIAVRPVYAGVTGLPAAGEPGAFGAVRKHDIHTGVDIYCDPWATVRTVEEGTVVAVEAFTGKIADSPWWNDTWAVLIEGASGVICYGEISPNADFKPGTTLPWGFIVGNVLTVLKEDKGVTPTSMLHFELYRHGTKKTVWWHHGEEKPEELLDPTELLQSIYGSENTLIRN
jgi:hypothetical protein